MTQIISYRDLPTSDLIVDAIYEGAATGGRGGLSDEPLGKLMPGAGNQGGFRPAGKGQDKKFVVLYTSGEDKDWPDTLDLNTGQFVYYGDNKSPGHELHDTQRGGNAILRRVFELLHSSQRSTVPPFFVFRKYPTPASSRSVQFKGIAVPGFPGLPSTADLVAVWKTTDGQRFQNYRSVFTVLDVPMIPRAWLNELNDGQPQGSAPRGWTEWVKTGRYRPLASESTTVIRSAEAQMPDNSAKKAILQAIYDHFKEAPIAFEGFAARIFQMHDPRVIVDAITRGVVDGGRDAYGRYLLGLPNDPVYAEFSLEAKCYRPGIGGVKPVTVGVEDVSRLISRIRHRQCGILVTTSLVARQAYQEVREDRHPILFFSGGDIANILVDNGFNTPALVAEFLSKEYPLRASDI
ncbi:restriction endonuclease [Bradyrhizobium japonicum]|uniref:restriction endonuclease n=1 Tax=Bradyrhizobium japonicum TaxID=375 RepID=UPI001BAD2704|nr:restriction endonuclease [Bradyrhizobium japonicum]MBR0730367.1 restriction endonuclease [Bradyrhizobium japonicum]